MQQFLLYKNGRLGVLVQHILRGQKGESSPDKALHVCVCVTPFRLLLSLRLTLKKFLLALLGSHGRPALDRWRAEKGHLAGSHNVARPFVQNELAAVYRGEHTRVPFPCLSLAETARAAVAPVVLHCG